MLIHRGFRYRIYPTAAQAERLRQWEGALRFLWNAALAQRLHAYGRCKVDRKYPSAFDQQRELTELRAALPWLADVPRHACDAVLSALDEAWKRCFARIAFAPRFKRKGHDTFGIAEPDTGMFCVDAASVTTPKIGALRAVIHRPLAGTPKRCTLTRDGDQWFASILCESDVADPVPSTKPAVAIDRGVAVLLADSDRRIVENPRHGAAMQPLIARAQRTIARRKKGSKNQQKARAKVARLQRKVRRQREHTLHVESHRYAKNHGAVIVEALKITNMTRSAKGTVEEPGANVAQKAGLNRAILDAGWGQLVRMLKYKVVIEGARVVEVAPQFSSQTCSRCGCVDARSRREHDVFLCVHCGHFDNADINAAQVLLVRGIDALAAEAAVTGCGGLATRHPKKQQVRPVRGEKRSARALA